MFFVTFFKAEPPIFDAVPQDGSDCTSVRVAIDGRAADCLAALLALGSFEFAHAVYAAGVSARQRDARARPVPPSPA